MVGYEFGLMKLLVNFVLYVVGIFGGLFLLVLVVGVGFGYNLVVLMLGVDLCVFVLLGMCVYLIGVI